MDADTTTVALPECELEELLEITLANQRAEGIILTSEEVHLVRSMLRKQHGLQEF